MGIWYPLNSNFTKKINKFCGEKSKYFLRYCGSSYIMISKPKFYGHVNCFQMFDFFR